MFELPNFVIYNEYSNVQMSSRPTKETRVDPRECIDCTRLSVHLSGRLDRTREREQTPSLPTKYDHVLHTTLSTREEVHQVVGGRPMSLPNKSTVLSLSFVHSWKVRTRILTTCQWGRYKRTVQFSPSVECKFTVPLAEGKYILLAVPV